VELLRLLRLLPTHGLTVVVHLRIWHLLMGGSQLIVRQLKMPELTGRSVLDKQVRLPILELHSN
jgi:hypothetical protein